MTAAGECPVCDAALTEIGGLTCVDCWARVPVRIRVAVVGARTARRRRPGAYDDARAWLLQWCSDQRAGRCQQQRTTWDRNPDDAA